MVLAGFVSVTYLVTDHFMNRVCYIHLFVVLPAFKMI